MCQCRMRITPHWSQLAAAENLLRLKKVIAEVLRKQQAQYWLFLSSLKGRSPQLQGGSIGFMGWEESSPAKILVSSVCVGRACRGRQPRADMRDDIRD